MTAFVHNHGPEDGPGVSCPERAVGGRLRGACLGPVPPLVGLIGKKRAGKDTVADVLVREYGYARVAFADPLKEAALALNPLVRVEDDETGPLREAGFPVGFVGGRVFRLAHLVGVIGWEAAKEVREVRRTLQRFGQGVRELSPDFWLRQGMERAEELRTSTVHPPVAGVRPRTVGAPVVVTDVRYTNEADEIRRAGGYLVRVLRPGQASTDTHSSEVELDAYPTNRVIVNDGTLDDVQREARLLARDLVL